MLHYISHNLNDEEIPLVMLHGAGLRGAVWHSLQEALFPYPTVAVDLPGHGKSPALERVTLAGYAKGVIELLDTLEIESFIPCGHSMGGPIAFHLASHYSDRVAGMILVNTAHRFKVPRIIYPLLKRSTLDSLTMKLLSKREIPSHQPPSLRTIVRRMHQELPRELLIDDLQLCERFDIREHLSAISCPSLIIGGKLDGVTPAILSEKLAEKLPHSQLEMRLRGGHFAMLEEPSEIAKIIQNWRDTTWCQGEVRFANKELLKSSGINKSS